MRRFAAEFVGTHVLVFAGTGAVVFNDASGGAITHVGVALTFGLVVLAIVYAVGSVSGAHLNPAVTVALWAAGKTPRRDVLPHIAAQFLGALTASLLLRALAPDHPTLGATLPRSGAAWPAFVLEVWLSAVLLFVVLSVLAAGPDVRLLGGVIIGAVVALEALFAGPISGASMNPARSFAPAVAAGRMEHLWIYLTAPILGGLLAVPLCVCVQRPGCCSRSREGCG